MTTLTSPNVKFQVINNNVFPNVPALGVSHVVAVTEKGPVGTAETIIHNITQFREIYGSETVLDGSISNIELALALGSNLRISRVDSSTSGETPSADWIKALEVFKEYDDAYQLFCSHIHQHITNEEEEGKVHIAAGKFASESKSVVYYIEVPKYSAATTPNVQTSMKTWKDAMSTKVGKSPLVAYFGGGFKYYDKEGTLQNCDTLGTVVGLGDASAKNFGPWYQFSGMNRGVVSKAKGIVIPNYGSIGNYDTLNALAGDAINVSVIKDTRLQGKQPMLWHNFTDTDTDNSEKFLGVVRLILYLKKNLRPVLESYLEEPNTFDTWKKIYFEVKPLLEDLVDKYAITEWSWNGDQDATNYNEMVVNNETDVRAGKYKVNLVFKEVIGMQEISVDLVLDASSNTISFAN